MPTIHMLDIFSWIECRPNKLCHLITNKERIVCIKRAIISFSWVIMGEHIKIWVLINTLFVFRLWFNVSMSWSQLVHPAQLSSGHSPHRRLNGGSTPAPGATTTLGQTYNLDSSMGLSSNGGFHSSDPSQVRLPSLHLSQFRTTLSPANFRPIRDPEHYEKLDQIGKGN
jgi:hypothetical protein